jgi:predicted transcriptional regulator
MNCSENIKKIRNQLFMTQAELAGALELSASIICKYETGSALPRRSTLKKLLEFTKRKGLKFKREDFLD